MRTPRELGAVIRQARLDARMSQQDLAARAGVSRPWLSELEKGKRTAEIGLVLRLLAAAGLSMQIDTATESRPAWDSETDDEGRG